MALYITVRNNEWSRKGDYLEDVGSGLVQKVTMLPDGGGHVPMDNFGLAFPLREVRDQVIRIQSRGLDRCAIKSIMS